MTTDREQLLEIRKAIIHDKLKGQSEQVKEKATKHLHLFEFKTAADFMAYADDTASQLVEGSLPDARQQQNEVATEEEIDEILGGIMPASFKSKTSKEQSESDKLIDEIFKGI